MTEPEKYSSPAKAGRDQAGRFQKGTSGNPKGRRQGSRHKATVALQSLLDGEGEAIIRKAAEKALEGDTAALRLCLERLLPPAKDRPIRFRFVHPLTAGEIPSAIGVVLESVAEGKLTLSEGERLVSLLDRQRQALETADLETRLTELQRKVEELDRETESMDRRY